MDNGLLDEAIRANMRVNRMHRHMIEAQVRDIGFHRTAHMTLMHLAKNEKSPSQRELAERFSITPAAVTGILKKLERDGYITRSQGRDGRFNEIYITELGREVVERSREAFGSIDRAMFDGFTDDELRVYIDMINRIENNLEREVDI